MATSIEMIVKTLSQTNKKYGAAAKAGIAVPALEKALEGLEECQRILFTLTETLTAIKESNKLDRIIELVGQCDKIHTKLNPDFTNKIPVLLVSNIPEITDKATECLLKINVIDHRLKRDIKQLSQHIQAESVNAQKANWNVIASYIKNTPEASFNELLSNVPELQPYLNTQNEAGNTFLHIAMQAGAWKIASGLITEKQANVTIANHEGKYPINLGIAGLLELPTAKLLEGLPPEVQGSVCFNCLAQFPQINLTDFQGIFKHSIKSFINTVTLLTTGDTFLHRAVALQRNDLIDWLLAEGADVSRQNKANEYPFLHVRAPISAAIAERLLPVMTHTILAQGIKSELNKQLFSRMNDDLRDNHLELFPVWLKYFITAYSGKIYNCLHINLTIETPNFHDRLLILHRVMQDLGKPKEFWIEFNHEVNNALTETVLSQIEASRAAYEFSPKITIQNTTRLEEVIFYGNLPALKIFIELAKSEKIIALPNRPVFAGEVASRQTFAFNFLVHRTPGELISDSDWEMALLILNNVQGMVPSKLREFVASANYQAVFTTPPASNEQDSLSVLKKAVHRLVFTYFTRSAHLMTTNKFAKSLANLVSDAYKATEQQEIWRLLSSILLQHADNQLSSFKALLEKQATPLTQGLKEAAPAIQAEAQACAEAIKAKMSLQEMNAKYGSHLWYAINHYQDKEGNSLLHLAVIAKNNEVIDYLLKNGASVTQTNKAGIYPFRYATTPITPEIAKRLLPDAVLLDAEAQTAIQEQRRQRVFDELQTKQLALLPVWLNGFKVNGLDWLVEHPGYEDMLRAYYAIFKQANKTAEFWAEFDLLTTFQKNEDFNAGLAVVNAHFRFNQEVKSVNPATRIEQALYFANVGALKVFTELAQTELKELNSLNRARYGQPSELQTTAFNFIVHRTPQQLISDNDWEMACLLMEKIPSMVPGSLNTAYKNPRQKPVFVYPLAQAGGLELMALKKEIHRVVLTYFMRTHGKKGHELVGQNRAADCLAAVSNAKTTAEVWNCLSSVLTITPHASTLKPDSFRLMLLNEIILKDPHVCSQFKIEGITPFTKEVDGSVAVALGTLIHIRNTKIEVGDAPDGLVIQLKTVIGDATCDYFNTICREGSMTFKGVLDAANHCKAIEKLDNNHRGNMLKALQKILNNKKTPRPESHRCFVAAAVMGDHYLTHEIGYQAEGKDSGAPAERIKKPAILLALLQQKTSRSALQQHSLYAAPATPPAKRSSQDAENSSPYGYAPESPSVGSFNAVGPASPGVYPALQSTDETSGSQAAPTMYPDLPVFNNGVFVPPPFDGSAQPWTYVPTGSAYVPGGKSESPTPSAPPSPEFEEEEYSAQDKTPPGQGFNPHG
jgi:ankyrin repeat protein